MKRVSLSLDMTDFLLFLDDEEAGRLFVSIMTYAKFDKTADMGAKEQAVFNRIKDDIDRQKGIYEKHVNVCLAAQAKRTEMAAEAKKTEIPHNGMPRSGRKRTLRSGK